MGDLFTRFSWAVPIPNVLAGTLAKVLLDELIPIFGPPERILSDREPSFTSELINKLSEYVVFKKIFSSPYHRQTDGFIEGFNRILMKNIRAYISVKETDWH